MTGIINQIKKSPSQGAAMHFLDKIVIVAAFVIYLPFAVSGGFSLKEGTLSLSGDVELQTGEMVDARMAKTVSSGSSEVTHAWSNDFIGMLDFNATLSEHLRVLGSFEFRQYIKISPPGFMEASYNLGNFLYQEFYFREGQGIFSLMRDKPLSIELALGYMPYKYNAQARDLGEFLFRSGTYPFYLLGEFDRPFARLTGLRATCSYKGNVVAAHLDELVLTETETPPFWDISLATVADATLMKIFTLGAGVDFAHCIPVDGRLTTPKADANKYVSDSTPVLDPATGQPTGSWDYTYKYYTFKGTKMMVHATLDPVGPFRGREGSAVSAVFGTEGGKIYFEGAIIGLENYPANSDPSTVPTGNPYGYNKLMEKMPWMVGINIPLWKILDVCALEFERYPSPYPNSTAMLLKNGLPLPYFGNLSDVNGFSLGSAYVQRWYWDLYMKKDISHHLEAVLQFGRDHQRWEMPLNFLNSSYDVEEATVKPNNWGWRLKLAFKF
jgi:hypothetical protein